jgi:23S rRNA pseudouridine955/2504/2580 synthase
MPENSRNRSSPGVRHIKIDAEHAGQRIDNFLTTTLKGAPRSLIYRILRRGEVRVNGGRIKPDYRLQEDDTLRIPPVEIKPASSIPEQSNPGVARLQSRILYEDAGMIIVNKPSGMAVHGGSGVQFGIIELLRVMYPQCKRLELVHRLDRETSGCLMLAKKTSVLRALHEQLREHKIEKVYLALLKGNIGKRSLKVDLPLKKNYLQSGERVVRIQDDGKDAQTIFVPEKHFSFASLARVKLLTGRTHQIRVHAQASGHELAGDDKYGEREFNKKMKELGLKRLFLHAQTLKFTHPQTGELVKVTAPLDDDLEKVLTTLEHAQ